MATTRAGDARDPALAEVLLRHEAAWVPMFLARAALGLTSVVWVSAGPAGAGGVALLSPVEASAWLRARGDTKGSARVAGTPSPGSAWGVGQGAGGHAVWSIAMTPILTRGQ
jgi:hypothetical protein